jgi:hypothetical protein
MSAMGEFGSARHRGTCVSRFACSDRMEVAHRTAYFAFASANAIRYADSRLRVRPSK